MKDHIPSYGIPQSDESSKQGLKIFRLKGREEKVLATFPRETAIPHRHPFYEICFFMEGGGESEMDFRKYPILSPGIHFIGPGRVHKIIGDAQSSGYVIAFTREFLAREEERRLLDDAPFFRSSTPEPFVHLTKDEFSYLRKIMGNMVEDFLGQSSEKTALLRSYLRIFLLRSTEIFARNHPQWVNTTSGSPHLVEQYLRLVENQFAVHHGVQNYASQLSVTPDHLSRTTRQILGKSAGEIILDRILLEARRLLLFSSLTAKEISYQLNFTDPSYFGRIFRKKVGMSPSAFRKQMQEKYQS